MTSRQLKLISIGTLAVAFAWGRPALAAEPAQSGVEAEGAVTLISDEEGTTQSGAVSEQPWIRRHRPRAHDFNLGVFAGGFFMDSEAELRDPTIPIGDWDSAAAEFGLRLGYYPLRHLGFEGEFAAIPTRNDSERAFVYSARAQVVLQPGFWRVTPFAVLGGGVLAVRSGSDVVGNEADQALHVGGGVKLFINKGLHIRLEARDVISPKIGQTNTPAHSAEALLTFAVRFGVGPKPPPPPEPAPDKDDDGIADEEDHCPFDPGVEAYEGCPVPDSDCDSVSDDRDECPQEAGEPTDGCPIPDADGDGILDDEDQCPNEAGPAPDGCPLKDTDGDGILDRKDKCVEQPETPNGFEDLDGCPDEVPPEVQKFTGVIQGIFFDTGKDTIKATSEPVLDSAAEVLTKYGDLKVEIAGHTDDRGKRDKNLDLSKRRAESVKKYLVGKGVAEDRVVTRGAGPDEPTADNKNKKGRAQNRRIEFKLVR